MTERKTSLWAKILIVSISVLALASNSTFEYDKGYCEYNDIRLHVDEAIRLSDSYYESL